MPRPRQHQHTAARVAAHRARQAHEGRQRLDLTVSNATAARLKAEAAARGCTIGEALEALLASTSATTATDTKATSAASTSQAPTRRTRRRCPRSGDEGVETRRTGTGWDRFAVIVDGHQVGAVTKARSGWRGETTDGHQVEGRVATAAVNRVLKAAHQSGLLEANTGGA